jgi:hypothetical protein
MLKKIHVDDLRLGMHIQEFCGSWMEHPFWRENFILDNADDARRIAESGISEVWIDVAKGVDVVSAPATTVEEAEEAVTEALIAAADRAESPTHVSMAEEVKRAARVCAKSREAVVSMFHEARMGKAVDAEAAGEMVDEISSSVLRNPGALISLARLKDADDYTYMHSVAVCALMVALSRQLGFGESETREAGMAGLRHDLGKALTPNEILNKPGKLTDAEFTIMKQHPVEGHRLLAESRKSSISANPAPLTRSSAAKIRRNGVSRTSINTGPPPRRFVVPDRRATPARDRVCRRTSQAMAASRCNKRAAPGGRRWRSADSQPSAGSARPRVCPGC